jgi:hypothetical protein
MKDWKGIRTGLVSLGYHDNYLAILEASEQFPDLGISFGDAPDEGYVEVFIRASHADHEAFWKEVAAHGARLSNNPSGNDKAVRKLSALEG